MPNLGFCYFVAKINFVCIVRAVYIRTSSKHQNNENEKNRNRTMVRRCSLYWFIIINNIKRVKMKAQIFFNGGNLLLLSIFDNNAARLDIVLNSIHTDIITRDSIGVLNNNVVTVFNTHIFATLPNVNELLKPFNTIK